MLRVHVGCTLLGEDPRVGAAGIEDGPNFLWLTGANVKLTDVGKVLRVSQRLLDLHVLEHTEADGLG